MNIYNLNDITDLSRPTAVTVGMFDGVHLGHRQMLGHLASMARQLNLEPLVVTFRNHPRLVLHPDDDISLLTTFDERMDNLQRSGVDNVVAIDFDTHTAQLSACEFASQILVRQLGMKFLLLGYDNKFGSRLNDDFSRLPLLAKNLDFDIFLDQPLVIDGVDVSSTKIRSALLHGDIHRANTMLGYNYSISGTVQHGCHVGSSLGFPTANIALSDNSKLLPADGVYALRASILPPKTSYIIHQTSYIAMANLGAQPTFGQSQRTLEVHILDFNGDLYGKTIRVEFLSRIRDIKHFDNPIALSLQLASDRETILNLFPNP